MRTVLAALTAASTMAAAAQAETQEIRLARQFSMGYLQLNALEDRKLLEQHAKAAGLGDVRVVWSTFNGPDNMNSALLSGSVDIASGGVPGLITLWGKTRGTAQEVKGIAAFSSQPFLLNTRKAEIKTLKDFTEADRIALPAIKVSVQAVTLQMAAAGTWGADAWGRLDPLTVSMSPPDSTIALLAGAGEVTAVFSVPPFQQQQLKDPKIHTVLNSFDVMGGPHTFTCGWTTAKFRNDNPRLYKALVAAWDEATRIVEADRAAAGRLWIEQSKSKLAPELVKEVVEGPQVRYTMTPEATTKFAAFMAKTGAIKEPPASWQDLFFPEIHALPGS
jgi:NitT/TauT family transport system substrate-binding protein